MPAKDNTHEVEQFLSALEGQARNIIAIADKAAKEADKHSFDVYTKFRKCVSEFETFSIIIEEKLKKLSGEKAKKLQKKFDKLSVLVFNHLIKASIKFFFVLSASTKLPLGARDICMAEMKRIYDAKQKLENPKYSSALDDEVKINIELADDILNEIIGKAPKLLNLAMAGNVE